MASDRLKTTPTQDYDVSTSQYYGKTDWKTGDIITQPKMMNIEDWLASATDELMEARVGYNAYADSAQDKERNRWPSVGARLDYLTRYLRDTQDFLRTQNLKDLSDRLTNIYDEIVAASGSYITRKFSLRILTSDWTGTAAPYTYTYTDTNKLSFLTSGYSAYVELGNSYYYLRAPLNVTFDSKKITFTTDTKPAGTLSVALYMQPSIEVI